MTCVRHRANHPQAGTAMSDPHVLLDLVSTVKRSIAPGSLEPSNNTRIIVHVAAMDHHHVGTRTSDQSTLLPKIAVAEIDPMATARISVLALGPSTQIDAHLIPLASRIANVATTLTSQMVVVDARWSRSRSPYDQKVVWSMLRPALIRHSQSRRD